MRVVSSLSVAVLVGTCSTSQPERLEEPAAKPPRSVETVERKPEAEPEPLGIRSHRTFPEGEVHVSVSYAGEPGGARLMIDAVASGEQAIPIEFGLETDVSAVLDGATHWVAAVPPNSTRRHETRLRAVSEGVVNVTIVSYENGKRQGSATTSMYVSSDGRIVPCREAGDRCSIVRPCPTDDDDGDEATEHILCCATMSAKMPCGRKLAQCRVVEANVLRACTDAGNIFIECRDMMCRHGNCTCSN